MNVFRYECRRYLPSSLIWAISLTFFGFLCIQLFTAFSADVTFFEKMLNAYSPEMLKAFGAELSTVTTLPGFYSFCFMYVIAVAAFQAMYLGIQVLGKELSGKTADFIFVKPMSRRKILTYKLASVLVCLVIVNVIYCIGTLLSASMTGFAFDSGMMIMINGAMFLTQLLFMSAGFLLACISPKIKTPLSLTTGIVCAFFLLQMVVNLEPTGILSYISFLNYVSADSILAHQGYEVSKLILLLVLSVGFTGVGYYVFEHRDIHTI